MIRRISYRIFRTGLLAAIVVSGAACTSTATKPASSHIAVQESVGFTITEEGRISSDTRLDYDMALGYLEQGRLDDGIALLETVVESASDLSAPRIDLGIAYHRAGDLEAAEQHLQLALQSSPEHPIAHNELGIIYRKTGRFAEARRSYEAALETYTGYHFARRNLAVLCDLYLADLECALRNYEAYMLTVPTDEEASMWIADIRYRMGVAED